MHITSREWKGKETDSTPEPLGGMQPCQRLDFRIQDLQTCVVLAHCVWGTLFLQQEGKIQLLTYYKSYSFIMFVLFFFF